jgi:multidrug resistance protein, MATE family
MQNELAAPERLPSDADPVATEFPAADDSGHGGYAELLKLAIPFILSSSFTTLQMFIDRVFVAELGKDATAACMPTLGCFWTPLALFQFTIMYVTVFVAQYSGAKRPERVGPIVWQGIWLGLGLGLIFPIVIPAVDLISEASRHAPAVAHLERVYIRGLAWAGLPMIVVAAFNGFFAGRQKSWTVLLINATGALFSVLFAIPLVLWRKHDIDAAMFNAGLAIALGSGMSVLMGALLTLQPRYDAEFNILRGWRPDLKLLRRLCYFGFPNGAQFCIEGLAFTAFIFVIGRMGVTELAATSITFALNLLTILPVMGLAQGVEVLVGQRQGEERPDVAAMTAHRGAIIGTAYMIGVAVLYCTIPHTLVLPFSLDAGNADWSEVSLLIPILLRFVAAYSLADGANMVYAFALRGAGDTRFVSLLAIGLSWPIMVIPTYLALLYGWGLLAAWGFATAYVVSLAIAFALRFRSGVWRTMKVIEPTVPGNDDPPA